MSEGKTVRISIYIEENKRARFKSACALHKKSMNEVLAEFVDEFLEKNESPTVKTNAEGAA